MDSMQDAPIHGFNLSPEEHRMLRGAPPREALEWAASAVAPDARVTSVHPLAGGKSSAVHVLEIETERGVTHELVLRRFVRADWLAEEPDLAVREVAALELLRGSPVPAPDLVAVDPWGKVSGAPSTLMTRLPGRIEWDPADLDTFLRRLSAPLPAIHAISVPADAHIPPYAPYPLQMRRPPRWAAQPDVWLRAIEIHAGSAPTEERRFIHRDYHPGNVLWSQGAVCGIVDWVNASLGSPEADVGHCRLNLAHRFGREAADRFLNLYQSLTGRRSYHPYWDIVAAVGGLDESRDDGPKAPQEERFLANAISAL